MTTPFKKSDLPPTPRRRRSTKSAPNAASRPAQPSTIVPLLDLVADLIARELWRQRSGSAPCLAHEASEAHPVAAAQGASPVVEKPGNSTPFPSFPAKSHLKCHLNPNNPQPMDKSLRIKENNS